MERELCESPELIPLDFFVGMDERRSLLNKGVYTYTRRITPQHFRSICPHKKREDQLRRKKKRYLRTRLAKCNAVDGGFSNIYF
jgi:hypothetical protein